MFLGTVKSHGLSQDFSKEGSHLVIHRVLTRLSPEYCRLFAYKKAYKGGGGGWGVTGTPGPLPGYALESCFERLPGDKLLRTLAWMLEFYQSASLACLWKKNLLLQ